MQATVDEPRVIGQLASDDAGVFGAAPCRDLAFWSVGMVAIRAMGAHLDPLAPSWAVTVYLAATAGVLLLLVGVAAYDSATGKLRNRTLVKAESVPAWARPGGPLTVALAIIGLLYPLLVVAGLFDDTFSLSDHVASATILVYFGLGLRLQWAVATGRMPSRVPVRPPGTGTSRLLAVSAILIVLAVLAVLAAAPSVIRRDQAVADCRAAQGRPFDLRELAGLGLDDAELQQRAGELLAARARPCRAS